MKKPPLLLSLLLTLLTACQLTDIPNPVALAGRGTMAIGTLGVSEFIIAQKGKQETNNKQRCSSYGYKEGTEAYGNCMLKLYAIQNQATDK